MSTPKTVDLGTLLDQIEARHGQWYGDDDYIGPAAQWPDRDYDETLAEYIARNDIPALVAALRAVLNGRGAHAQSCGCGSCSHYKRNVKAIAAALGGAA